ncbi:hypothetical protein [Lysobacter sp. A289]
MDAAVPFAATHTRPAFRILSTWLADAWRLFRRAPVRMFLLPFATLVGYTSYRDVFDRPQLD